MPGLTEQENFILSFVDGKTPVKEIAKITGFGLTSVNKILEKLSAAKVIIFQHPQTIQDKTEQQSIKELYLIYENADPAAILGIPENAGIEQIKNAYFEKTKTFHPDSYYARSIAAEERNLLVEIYKKIQQAYDILKSRSLQKDRVSNPPEQPAAAKRKEESPVVKLQQSAKQNVSGLSAINSAREKIRKAGKYYQIGMQAFIGNDYSAAYLNFKLANSYNPYEKRYLNKLEEAKNLMKVDKYQNLLKKADISIELNKPEDAVNYLKSAVELTNEKVFLYYKIALVMYDFDQSMREAKQYCQKAIAIDPQNPDYHLLLAGIYRKVKLFKSSIAEYEYTMSMGIKTDEIKNEIKQLKNIIKSLWAKQ